MIRLSALIIYLSLIVPAHAVCDKPHGEFRLQDGEYIFAINPECAQEVEKNALTSDEIQGKISDSVADRLAVADNREKTVYVRSYKRKDGTQVRAHKRRPPKRR